VSDAPPPDEALALLGDEYASEILIATTEQPMTATTIAEEIDAAPSTVYDRIEDLDRVGFLAETTRTDDRGNHYAEYSARLERLSVDVTADGFELSAAYDDRDQAAERLHALWSDLR
jgi:predicted transcriptional regulator